MGNLVLRSYITKIVFLIGVLVLVVIVGNLGFEYLNNQMMVANQKMGILQIDDTSTSYLNLKNQIARFQTIKLFYCLIFFFVCSFISLITTGLIIRTVVIFRKRGV
jgi:hypothetical protein